MFAILLSDKMDPFYQNIASFPTAIFTFFLGVCLLYWLVAVLGLVDIEILDFDAPEFDADMDISSSSSADVLAGLLLRFGLHGVPVTIIISLVALFGWLICYYLAHITYSVIPGGLLRYITGIPIFIASLYIAVMISAQVIKPIRSLFSKALHHSPKNILGQTAIVKTSRVDTGFGEATMADGGAGLLLKVRATGDSQYQRGDRVVLLEYNTEANTYRVVSEQEFAGM